MTEQAMARICGGVPAVNSTLYGRIRFLVGDPVALLELPADGAPRSVLILRDIEMHRARRTARVDEVACPADFAPEEGLSGDRETATAQAAAECLLRRGQRRVVADRSLPLLYHEMLRRAGIEVVCDPELWVAERRRKDPSEVDALRASQQVTESAIRMVCEKIAAADTDAQGRLMQEGEPLTSERLRRELNRFLMDHEFDSPTSIIAGGPTGADCHDVGAGPLFTGQPVIVDVFPRSRRSRYWGDCTRTVVHGDVSSELQAMHAAVRDAKAAAEQATRAGVTGEAVHLAATNVIRERGFQLGIPGEADPDSYCAMIHGTGHGVGLDIHEPPLLDRGGPELLVGDALTIEPGLYRRDLGGVRIEDMVVVTADGCENLNQLPDDLTWS